jgi:hypothetical protein
MPPEVLVTDGNGTTIGVTQLGWGTAGSPAADSQPTTCSIPFTVAGVSQAVIYTITIGTLSGRESGCRGALARSTLAVFSAPHVEALGFGQSTEASGREAEGGRPGRR